jgi:hypothetical protein
MGSSSSLGWPGNAEPEGEILILSAFGGLGVGFVWGWLVGNRSGRGTATFGSALTLCVATLVFAAEIFLVTNWLCVALFLAAMFVALESHFVWVSALQSRLTTDCLL